MALKKREIIIKTNEQYPQYLKFEFTQDKTSVLDSYSTGQTVTIDYNLRGNLNKDQDNAFVSLQGWKILKVADNF